MLNAIYMKTILKIKNREYVLFLIVITLGLGVAFYLYSLDKHSLIYYGDAVSHLVSARKIVDWADNPGLAQVGSVWLPLPHFLLAPFSLIDPLFTTGFAGLAVSLPSLAITSLLLYRMILRQTGLSHIAFVGALLYASNPNILYMGITAMTEAPFMLFFVTAAYYFQQWHENLDVSTKSHYLLKCSIFVSLATLCRYEGWIIPVFVTFFVIIFMVRKQIHMDARHKLAAILISILSFSGIALWLIWNLHVYNDPLEFAHAQYYSAAFQALNRTNREMLFLQPFNVAEIYGATSVAMYGPVLLGTAVLGYIFHRRLKGNGDRTILYVFLALPPAFTIASLLIGVGEMSFWFNARFLMLLSPLIIMLSSLFIAKSYGRIKKIALACIVGIIFLNQIMTPIFGVVTFVDAQGGFVYKQHPFAVQTGEVLGSMYHSGTIFILTGSSQEHIIMQSSGIPLRQFDDIIGSSTWKISFKEPWLHDKWVVIGKEPNDDAQSAARYWINNQELLNEHYRITYENEYYKILVLK